MNNLLIFYIITIFSMIVIDFYNDLSGLRDFSYLPALIFCCLLSPLVVPLVLFSKFVEWFLGE